MNTYLFVNSKEGINLTIQALDGDDAITIFHRCFFENKHEWKIYFEMDVKLHG